MLTGLDWLAHFEYDGFKNRQQQQKKIDSNSSSKKRKTPHRFPSDNRTNDVNSSIAIFERVSRHLKNLWWL